MRFCLVVALALLMPANFPAGANQNEKEVSSHISLKEGGKKSRPNNDKDRVFRVEFEIGIEQKTYAGVIINGAPLYDSRTLDRKHSTFNVTDGKSVNCGRLQDFDEKRQKRDYSYTIKVESVANDQVRLDVTTKDKRTFTLPDGSIHSQNLILRATKTVKLGEKIKLDLTDESLLGIKATFEGVIEEKVKD